MANAWRQEHIFFPPAGQPTEEEESNKSLQRADGQVTENVIEMENLTTALYQRLYTSEGVHDMVQVLDTVPTKVTQTMTEMLNAPYSQKEVKTALFQMCPTKAPGPDGFMGIFYCGTWTIIKNDIIVVLLKVYVRWQRFCVSQ